MYGDKCDHTCACPHMCKIPITSEKSLVPASLSTVQSHILNRNFVVATATLVIVTVAFITLLYPFLSWDIWHASATRNSVFRIHKFWIACAIPNNQEQLLVQTRVHVRITALSSKFFRVWTTFQISFRLVNIIPPWIPSMSHEVLIFHVCFILNALFSI